MRDHFDFIIVDTPPCSPSVMPCPVATHADGTLLVAMADKTDRRAYDHAANVLHDVGATLLGGVLNRFDTESSAYGYSYSYGYGYNYGYVYSYQPYGGLLRRGRGKTRHPSYASVSSDESWCASTHESQTGLWYLSIHTTGGGFTARISVILMDAGWMLGGRAHVLKSK